jgi:hypothetical protein
MDEGEKRARELKRTSGRTAKFIGQLSKHANAYLHAAAAASRAQVIDAGHFRAKPDESKRGQ